MTRKVIAAAIGLLVGMTLFASPASAETYGKRCGVYGSIGHPIGRMCVMVNRRWNLQVLPEHEALAEATKWDTEHFWKDSTIQWRFDWVHLYKGSSAVRTVGSTGWMQGWDTSYSTSWHKCTQDMPPYQSFRAVARFQFRAEQSFSGDMYYSIWDTYDSTSVSLACGPSNRA